MKLFPLLGAMALMSFIPAKIDSAHSFKVKAIDGGTIDLAAGRKLQLDELAETRRVVVTVRLCVAKRLQQRVGLQHLPQARGHALR